MIQSLILKGFKCFVNETIELEPLTLLSGLNSSGKSSIIQAIRLCLGGKALDGHGPLDEFVSSHSKSFELSAIGPYFKIDTKFIDGNFENKCTDKSNIKFRYTYISAGRLGPKPSLPLSTDSLLNDVGEFGEFVLDFLDRYSELSGLPLPLRESSANSSSVRVNAAAWLNLISPGVDFKFSVYRKSDVSSAEFSSRRPTNVGFGLSYTLPIIVTVLVYSALIAKDEINSALILIENPEAHLHPAGQTALGYFLAKAAANGVQIIIETHSDHLLNGIRIAVKDRELSSDDSAFYYLRYDFKNELTTVQRPLIDEYGMFDEWPKGFFDEMENSLGRLI